MSRHRIKNCFENNENIGSYKNISFDIMGNTDLGKEIIRFDTKIHYLEKGDGEPLLLVHGIGQSLFTWRNNIDYFANNGYRVLALDLSGFGYSAHPHIYYTVEEYALIIKSFLDALGIKKANIAAFSTGCLSAVCLAALHPKCVGKLILISPGGPNENYPFIIKFLTTRLGHTIFKHYFSSSIMRNIIEQLYFDATLVSDHVVQGYYQPYLNKDVRETLVINMVHYDDAYALSLLKSITHQTMIFSGKDDKIHTQEMINAFEHKIQNTRHIRLRNCAHFVHEEKPQKLNTSMLAFLDDRDSVSGTTQLINAKYLL